MDAERGKADQKSLAFVHADRVANIEPIPADKDNTMANAPPAELDKDKTLNDVADSASSATAQPAEIEEEEIVAFYEEGSTTGKPMSIPHTFDKAGHTFSAGRKGFFDSCAGTSVMSLAFYGEHKHLIGPLSPGRRLRVADGNVITTEGQVKLSVSFPHDDGFIRTQITFQVMKTEDAWDVLFGVPLAKQLRLWADFGNWCIRVEAKGHWRRIRAYPETYIEDQATPTWAVGMENRPAEMPELLPPPPSTSRMAELKKRIQLGPQLSPQQREDVWKVVEECQDAWAIDMREVLPNNLGQCDFDIKKDVVLPTKPRRKHYSPQEIEAMQAYVDYLEEGNFIKPIDVDKVKCVSDVIMVPKRIDALRADEQQTIDKAEQAIAMLLSEQPNVPEQRLGSGLRPTNPGSTTHERSAGCPELPVSVAEEVEGNAVSANSLCLPKQSDAGTENIIDEGDAKIAAATIGTGERLGSGLRPTNPGSTTHERSAGCPELPVSVAEEVEGVPVSDSAPPTIPDGAGVELRPESDSRFTAIRHIGDDDNNKNILRRWRMVLNLKPLNAAINSPPYLPGDLHGLVASLVGCDYMTVIDQLAAFWAWELSERCQPYTCFFVQGRGYYCHLRMPQGLNISPYIQQLGSELAYRGLLGKWLKNLMDDLFYGSKLWRMHLEHLREAALRAIRHGIKWSADKTKIGFDKIKVAGQIVSKEGVSADPEKVKAIRSLARPATVTEVLAFTNKVGFHRRSIKDYAKRIAPLTDLTRNVEGNVAGAKKGQKKKILRNTAVVWGEAQERAWNDILGSLEHMVNTFAPIYDGCTPFHVDVDACSDGFGAHLYQMANNTVHTIEYASRRTSIPESQAHSFILELKAVKWALEKFRPTIYGQKVILHTDCQAVKGLLNTDRLSFQQSAIREAILNSGDVEFVHKAGKQNVVADYLSRYSTGGPSRDCMRLEHGNDAGIPVRWVDEDEYEDLRNRFRNDPLYAVVCFLTKLINSDDDIVTRKAKLYYVGEGQLWKRRVDGQPLRVLTNEEGRTRSVEAHAECGHFGKDITVRHIQREETWSTIIKDVTDAVLKCSVCSKFGPRVTNSLLRTTLRYRPLDALAMDYLHMPVTSDGFQVMLVAVDLYTKFIFAWAFDCPPSGQTTLVALTDLRQRLATPNEIIVDNARSLINTRTEAFAKEVGMIITPAAPYAHVASAENANHQILERLRRITRCDVGSLTEVENAEAMDTWPVRLQASVAALNDRRLASLGDLSPREALLGRVDDRQIPLEMRDELQARENVNDWVRSERDRDVTSKQKPSKKPVSPFRVGQLVQVYDPRKDDTHDSARKLKIKWSGPYKIVEISRGSAKLVTLEGHGAGRAGFDRLRPWAGVLKETEKE